MIMESGQVFRIQEIEKNLFFIAAGNRGILVRQTGEFCQFSCNEQEFHEFWYPYFDLATDYGKLKAAVDPDDEFLQAAVRYGGGIRVLKQDLWEMIISFLISQNNNISRIRKSIEALCDRYGTIHKVSQEDSPESAPIFYSFPTPEAVFQGGLEGLQGLGLGYRDKYILKMAERCRGKSGSEWLASLKECSYEDAVTLLTSEFGIGRKVADCICLFALHHVDAFPIDTHIRQILDQYYPQGFPFERYQGFAGILQQYMFAYKLTLPKNKH